jgi:hypothetical protein
MESQQAREQLIAELKRQGLPPAYIQRLVEELDDHLTDLQDERTRAMNTSDDKTATAANADYNAATVGRAGEPETADILNLQHRLGDPAQLAAFAAKQYRNRSFLGRHPILTFLIAPLPLVIVGLIMVCATIYLLSHAFGYLFPKFDPDDSTVTYAFIGALLFWLVLVVPPLTTAAFLCRLARRNARNWRWAIVACALIALFCADTFVASGVPFIENGRIQAGLCVGLMLLPPFTGSSWSFFLLHFVPQFSLAFSIGLLLIKRAQRLQKLDEACDEAVILRRAA